MNFIQQRKTFDWYTMNQRLLLHARNKINVHFTSERSGISNGSVIAHNIKTANFENEERGGEKDEEEFNFHVSHIQHFPINEYDCIDCNVVGT